MSFMASAIYAECRKYAHYAECLYAECRYAECHGAFNNAIYHYEEQMTKIRVISSCAT